MTPRSQVVIALAVLLIGLVAVMALVGDAGVQTTVFSKDSTWTPVPTPIPSPTPVPVASAQNWMESETEPGVWTYTADPGLEARITVAEKTIDQTAADLGVSAPPADSALPGLAILTTLGGDLQAQIAGQPDADIQLEAPATKLYNGQPVSILRFSYGPNINPNYPRGIDVALAMIDLSDDRINSIEYFADTNTHDAAYAGFEAWMIENMAMLTESETEGDADTDADAETETESDTETEGDTDTETEADTEAGTETESDADTSADAETETDTEADTGTDETSAAGQTWLEVAPGQLIYAANPNVMVLHRLITVDDIIASLGLEDEADPPSTPIELLDAMQAALEVRYTEVMGVDIPADAFVGPANVTYGGVQMAELGLSLEAATDPGTGQEMPVQATRQFLIDLGGDTLYFIQLITQGEVDAAVAADFETWLNENAPIFAETEPVDE